MTLRKGLGVGQVSTKDFSTYDKKSYTLYII